MLCSGYNKPPVETSRTQSVKKGNDQRVNSSQQMSCVMSKLFIHRYQMEHLTPEKGLGITENHRDLCANVREKAYLHIIKNRRLLQ